MKLIKFSCLIIIMLLFGCDVTKPSVSGPIICLSFDDQFGSVYTEALPLMMDYNFRGTLFVNTGRLGSSGLLSWDQVEELVYVHGWETGGHTLNHANLPELSYEEAYEEIQQDWLNLVNRGLPHNSFALPSGHASEEQYSIIFEFYDNLRTSLNLQHYEPVNRQYLGYFPYQIDYDPELFKGRIIEGIERREDLIILGFHSFSTAESDEYSYCEIEVFQEILQFIYDNDLEVFTIQEACELLSE